MNHGSWIQHCFYFMKKTFFILALLFSFIYAPMASALDYDEDGIEPGYRGFVDFSYTLGVGDWGKDHDRINLMTSHGIQIVPQLYVGLGVGVNYFYDDEAVGLPIFGHFRSDFIPGDVTPFFDMRIGYSLIDVEGFYLNPSLGCRFAVSDNVALNLSVGYTLQKAEYYYDYRKQNCGGVDFRFGIEF